MAFSKLFTKFKGLGPVVVVGTAVLVTIKLLTTQTPQIEEIIQVKAEEDIKTEDYKDEIKEPEEPPAPPAEEEKEKQVEETQPQEESEEEDSPEEEGAEDEADSQENEEKREEEKEKQQDPPKPAGRTWISDPSNKVATLLKGILTPKGKK